MERVTSKSISCAVCGTETHDHSGWFLVVENRWMDRLKVLFWHPLLAKHSEMQSVCGKRHLKVLITHWLTQANLDYPTEGACSPFSDSGRSPVETCAPHGVGRLVGELAVHRESFSHVWSGSPETLECILAALISGLSRNPPQVEVSWVDPTIELSMEYAFQ